MDRGYVGCEVLAGDVNADWQCPAFDGWAEYRDSHRYREMHSLKAHHPQYR